MARVLLRGVSKQFGAVAAVQDVSLEALDREFLVLLGPSGCGKTTLLRLIAGLETPTAGEIWIGDRPVHGLAPKDRDIAMVFQNYALYPHMSVFDNMAFGLKMRKTPRREIERRVQQAAELLDIAPLLRRKPRELSGGERQRVALARAIVREPQVFLMDEPLSNLDAQLRVHTRAELVKLQRRLQTTVIYVTHDQTEAMTMADRVAVLRSGVLQQVDAPQAMYERPANRFVAGFLGSPGMNFCPGRIETTAGRTWIAAGEFTAPCGARRALAAGQDVVLGIRPEDLRIEADGQALPPQWASASGEVDMIEPLGSEKLVHLVVGGARLVARVDPRLPVATGARVTVRIDPARCHLFDAATGERLDESAG